MATKNKARAVRSGQRDRRARRDPKPKYRFPLTRAVFRAFLGVGVAGEHLLRQFDDVFKLAKHHQPPEDLNYHEPVDCVYPPKSGRRMADAIGFVRSRKDLGYIESLWVGRLDQFHQAHFAFRMALDAARRAVDAAVPELDKGRKSPFDMPSLRLRRALGEVGGVWNPMTYGPWPTALPKDTRQKLERSLGRLLRWENYLRAAAHQEIVRTRPEGQRGTGIPLEVADAKARRLIAADPKFALGTAREWAKALGCSVGLVSALAIWREYQQSKSSGRGSRPEVQSLTSDLEANVTADGKVGRRVSTSAAAESELERLVHEQDADFEPSPLDSDGRQTVRERKRL